MLVRGNADERQLRRREDEEKAIRESQSQISEDGNAIPLQEEPIFEVLNISLQKDIDREVKSIYHFWIDHCSHPRIA